MALTKAGLSESAARKRIQRAADQYERFAGVRFEKNARFIYLKAQYGDQRFWDKFESACYQAGKSYWSTVVTLKARGGVTPLDLFARVAGAPAARKGQLSADRILERLQKINLLNVIEDGERKYVCFKPLHYHRDSLPELRANELAEGIALIGVKDWARKIGFGSYGKFASRYEEKEPLVSGILWDLTAPSYMRPLVSIRGGRAIPGFIVCDINLRGVIGKAEAEAFIRKCDLAASPQKVPPILPMLVGHVFESEALTILKGKGVLAITLGNLFGEELAQALRDLVTMLTDLGAKISGNPDLLPRVINTLSKIQGAADNMLGDLFELVIAGVVKDIEGGYLKTGEVRTHAISGQQAEIDVLLDRGNDKGVLVLECKAKKPNARVSEADIRKWYNNRVPLIYSILSNDGYYTGKPFRFELWSNGSFAQSGLKWLKEQKTDFDGYSIGWKQAEDLKNYTDKVKNKSLKDMLNEHYFRSALKKVVE
ncbi:hypothetical protein [Thalassospira xiamenensis]|uniref:hypothetical protein n=1 Tax=Thalassospira xiamenensis TaxID=220697 RepID=UPI001C68E99A|nr:hypothetical protein [Thalassospira xiamenensis]